MCNWTAYSCIQTKYIDTTTQARTKTKKDLRKTQKIEVPDTYATRDVEIYCPPPPYIIQQLTNKDSSTTHHYQINQSSKLHPQRPIFCWQDIRYTHMNSHYQTQRSISSNRSTTTPNRLSSKLNHQIYERILWTMLSYANIHRIELHSRLSPLHYQIQII